MSTMLQRKTAKILSENPRKSVSGAMKDAGYAKTSAQKPQELTTSKAWAELMEEFIPEALVAKQHNVLLKAKKKTKHYTKEGKVIKTTTEVDSEAIKAGVDMAYKLRGRYKPTVVHIQNFTGWTPEELEAYAATGIIPERFVDEGESTS